MPFKDKEKAKEYQARWYQKNRQQKLEAAKKYREDNPEKVAAAKKRCYERTKDDPLFKAKVRNYQKKRREDEKERVKAIEKRCYEKNKKKRMAAQRLIQYTPQRQARQRVQLRIRQGKIPPAKDMLCCACGKQANEYHHVSYEKSKWEYVSAYCHQCHKNLNDYANLGPIPDENAH